ncbi:MAG: response regulator [Bacteroidia bacterium]
METIKKRLVFIVEDNELYSLMLQYSLSNDTVIQCICFKTGEECIQNLDMDPMLVILDFWLPGMNGKETFEQIQQKKPDIPVVMLTRNQDKKLKKEFIKKGVYDYLYKEDDSILQIKKIINSVHDEIIKEEQNQSTSIKIIFCILFFIAIIIAFTYMNRT